MSLLSRKCKYEVVKLVSTKYLRYLAINVRGPVKNWVQLALPLAFYAAWRNHKTFITSITEYKNPVRFRMGQQQSIYLCIVREKKKKNKAKTGLNRIMHGRITRSEARTSTPNNEGRGSGDLGAYTDRYIL